MNWINFNLFSIASAIFLLSGSILVLFAKHRKMLKTTSHLLYLLGIFVLGSFIALMWLHLERPPLRTLGETRLWYALFLPVVGYIVFLRWGYHWFLGLSALFSMLFLGINYYHPETWDKELMPALQSPWFVPHVVVYIFSYSLLGVSWLMAVRGIFASQKNTLIQAIDNIVYAGFTFLTLGLIFGALWAKEAWGHYWTWDPKETWALLTWLVYLIYIHLRYKAPSKVKAHLWLLTLAFVFLLLCWFGLSFLPSAQNSVHIYRN